MAAWDAQVEVRQLPAVTAVGEPGLPSQLSKPLHGRDAALGFSTRDSSEARPPPYSAPLAPTPLARVAPRGVQGSASAPAGESGSARGSPGTPHPARSRRGEEAERRGPGGPARARWRGEGGGGPPGSRAGNRQERAQRTRAKRRAQPGGRGRAREGSAPPGATLTWSREVSATEEEEETGSARGRESS